MTTYCFLVYSSEFSFRFLDLERMRPSVDCSAAHLPRVGLYVDISSIFRVCVDRDSDAIVTKRYGKRRTHLIGCAVQLESAQEKHAQELASVGLV